MIATRICKPMAALTLAVILFGSLVSASCQIGGILIEHIEVDARAATALLLETEDPSLLRDAMGTAPLQAKVTDVSYISGTKLETAKISSRLEFLYPSEFDPAQVVGQIEIDVPAGMDLKVPAHPIAFETRNLGNELELKGDKAAGGSRQMTLQSEVARLSRIRRFGADELGISQPEFDEISLTTEIGMDRGGPELLGVFTPRSTDRRDRRVFVFARPFSSAAAGSAEGVAGAGELDDDPFRQLDEADTDPVFGVTVGVELIEVEQSQLDGLLDAIPAKAGDRSRVREEVETLLEAGRAERVASGTLKTVPGQRAKIEPAQELIYPTEYDPPELVAELTEAVLESGKAIKLPAVPTAFDCRFVGLLLEAQPQLTGNPEGGGGAVGLKVHFELTELVRRIVWGKGLAEAEQPIFRVIECSTELRIRPGEATLAAVLTPRRNEDGGPDGDRRFLVFTWVDVARDGGG